MGEGETIADMEHILDNTDCKWHRNLSFGRTNGLADWLGREIEIKGAHTNKASTSIVDGYRLRTECSCFGDRCKIVHVGVIDARWASAAPFSSDWWAARVSHCSAAAFRFHTSPQTCTQCTCTCRCGGLERCAGALSNGDSRGWAHRICGNTSTYDTGSSSAFHSCDAS